MTVQPRILKSTSASELLTAGQFNYEDLRQRCDNYLQTIREQAQRMLLEAQQQVEQIRKNAVEQGRQTGLAEGLKQSETQIQQRLQQQAEQLTQQRLSALLPVLQKASGQLQQERQNCLAHWELQAMELVMTVCEKLVHQQLAVDPLLLKARLSEILQLTIGAHQIVIRVATTDLEQLGPELETVIQAVEQRAEVQILADPALAPGDYIVETEHGQIDARIQTQLNRIAHELIGP